MKTIAPKDAFKLFLFSLILLSAKTFSHPKLPNMSNSSDCESKFGVVKKTSKKPVTTSDTYSSAYKGIAMQSKNIAGLKSNLTARVSLKVRISE